MLRVILAFVLACCGCFAQAPAARADIPRVHLSEGSAAGLLLKMVQPVYPADAKRNRVEGDVVLRILIGIDGGVTVLDVVSGNPALRDAAKSAVLQWRYITYERRDRIYEVVTLARVRFRLARRNQMQAQ